MLNFLGTLDNREFDVFVFAWEHCFDYFVDLGLRRFLFGRSLRKSVIAFSVPSGEFLRLRHLDSARIRIAHASTAVR